MGFGKAFGLSYFLFVIFLLSIGIRFLSLSLSLFMFHIFYQFSFPPYFFFKYPPVCTPMLCISSTLLSATD